MANLIIMAKKMRKNFNLKENSMANLIIMAKKMRKKSMSNHHRLLIS